MTDLRRLEEAAMNAWPALEQVLFDGWVLRAAGGYTKRANSVNPTYPAASADLSGKIAACEAFYVARKLPAIFRLTSFGAPAGLDAELVERGYHLLDESLVMQRDLIAVPPAGGEIVACDLADWLPLFCRLQGVLIDGHILHAEMLARIPGEALFAVLPDEAACGLAVREGDCVGLFDVVTDPAHRRQGHGSRLVEAMLSWAADRGATTAYLQVVGTNTAAQALYFQRGFTVAYDYWYRVRSA